MSDSVASFWVVHIIGDGTQECECARLLSVGPSPGVHACHLQTKAVV
jgi:hypothetical protein